MLLLSAALAVVATMDEIPQRQQQQHHQHERCGYFASRALCRYVYPQCKMTRTGAVPIPRRLCRSDCEALETNVCRTLYDLTKSHPAISKCTIPQFG